MILVFIRAHFELELIIVVSLLVLFHFGNVGELCDAKVSLPLSLAHADPDPM